MHNKLVYDERVLRQHITTRSHARHLVKLVSLVLICEMGKNIVCIACVMRPISARTHAYEWPRFGLHLTPEVYTFLYVQRCALRDSLYVRVYPCYTLLVFVAVTRFDSCSRVTEYRLICSSRLHISVHRECVSTYTSRPRAVPWCTGVVGNVRRRYLRPWPKWRSYSAPNVRQPV
jgi:hypothetical protein